MKLIIEKKRFSYIAQSALALIAVLCKQGKPDLALFNHLMPVVNVTIVKDNTIYDKREASRYLIRGSPQSLYFSIAIWLSDDWKLWRASRSLIHSINKFSQLFIAAFRRSFDVASTRRVERNTRRRLSILEPLMRTIRSRCWRLHDKRLTSWGRLWDIPISVSQTIFSFIQFNYVT